MRKRAKRAIIASQRARRIARLAQILRCAQDDIRLHQHWQLPAMVHARSVVEPVLDFEENRRHSGMGGNVHWRGMLAAALITLGWTASVQAKDLAFISNKANSVTTLTLPEAVKVCKGQLGHWPDGKPVSFITRDPAEAEMRLLLEKVYGMSKEDVKTLIASANHGRGDHPAIIVLSSDEAVVKKVESTPGAIGVVDVYSISGGVTVLKLGGKLPLEPGYPLHGN
jgi:hypothetical protein